MGLFDFLFEDSSEKSEKTRVCVRSVFENDRFRIRNSGNWVVWEDVSTGDVDTDGYEHPYYDDKVEW